MESSLAPGHMLRARFRITGVLGRGGMGTVYEAFDREEETHVALKVVRATGGAQAIYDLKREFRILADLRHPNLVRLGELFGEGDEWFFTMERVEGVDLLTWIRGGTAGQASTPAHISIAAAMEPEEASAERSIPRGLSGRWEEGRLRSSLGQLATAVHAMHGAGHVHRDLKPSNVLVTPEGRVVVIDFGIARPHLGASTATRRAIEGTVAYMAPEQASDAKVGPGADWYSIGVMLFEAITGVLPHEGPPARVLVRKAQEAPPWPSSIAPCPPDLDALVVELLAPEVSERPDLATVMRVAGTPIVAAEAQEAPTATLFVGRQAELDKLRAAFDQRRRGRPAVIRVTGESGVGKSALVSRFLSLVSKDHPGLVRLAGRCYANELVPYKAWDGVIDALTRHLRRMEDHSGAAHLAWQLPRNARALARVFPGLERVTAIADLIAAEGPAAPRSPERLRGDAFEALRELFRALTQHGPLIIAIDDWQWADRDSRLLFDDLTLHPEAPALVLVVTERDERLSAVAGLETRVTLGRLSQEETQTLARELGERDPIDLAQARSSLLELAHESGGHPMFLQQLVHHLEQGKRGSLKLDDVIRERAAALPIDARAILDLVCVAGVPLSRGVVLAASDLDATRCSTAIDELAAAQLVRAGGPGQRLEPWHDRIREAVEASLPDARRAGIHAALADALSRSPDDDESALGVVRHLAAAGHAERAAQAALGAARRAEKTLAFDRAAELYRLALELGRPGDELALRLALSNALSNAGRGALEAAHGFLAAADATANADDALELRTRALEQLSISGHVSQALELLRRLCRDVGVNLPRGRVGIFFAYMWHRVRLRLMGLPQRIDGAAPPRSAAEHRLYMTAFMHLPLLDPLLANWLHARTLVLALRTRDRAMLGLCLCREAGISLTFDASRTDHALRASQLAHSLFDQDEEIDHRAWLNAGDALRCYFSGRFQASIGLFREADAVWSTEERNYVAHLSQIAVFILGCQRYLGQVEALRRELLRVRRDAAWRGNTYLETVSTLCANVAVLLQDGPEAAEAELARVDPNSQLVRWGVNEWYQIRGDAEIALHRGVSAVELRRVLAPLRRLLRREIAWVVTFGAEMRALEGRLLLACAERGDASGLRRVAKIAKRLRAEVPPYSRVYGALLDAAVTIQRGDSMGGRATLEACAVEADLHGYTLCAAGARSRLAELRGVPSDEARAYFAHEGISDVEAALRVVAPGFRAIRELGAGRTGTLLSTNPQRQ